MNKNWSQKCICEIWNYNDKSNIVLKLKLQFLDKMNKKMVKVCCNTYACCCSAEETTERKLRARNFTFHNHSKLRWKMGFWLVFSYFSSFQGNKNSKEKSRTLEATVLFSFRMEFKTDLERFFTWVLFEKSQNIWP